MSTMRLLRVLGVLFLVVVGAVSAAEEPAAPSALALNDEMAGLGMSRSWIPRISVNLGYDSKYKIEGITVDEAGLALTGEVTMSVNDFYVSFRGRRAGRHETYESSPNYTVNQLCTYDCDEEFFSDVKFTLGYAPTLEDVPLVGRIKLNLAAMFTHFAPAFADHHVKCKTAPGVYEISGETSEGTPYTSASYPGVYFRDNTTPISTADFEAVDSCYKYRAFDENAFGLSVGGTLEDVFLKPNATVVWEPVNNRLWGQFGVQYEMPLDFISDRLTWTNTLDFYWYKHGFWEGEIESYSGTQNYSVTSATRTTTEFSFDAQQWYELGSTTSASKTKTGSDPGEREKRKSGVTKTSLPNGIWRSTLTYALTDAATLSFYTALEYNFDRDFLEEFSGSVDTLEGYCGVQLNMEVGASGKNHDGLKLERQGSIWPKGWEPRFTLKTGYDSKYKIQGQSFSDDDTYSAELGIAVNDFFFALRGVSTHEQAKWENSYDSMTWEQNSGGYDYNIVKYSSEFDKEALSEWSATLGYNYVSNSLPYIGRVTLTPTVYFTHRAPCFSRTRQKCVFDYPTFKTYFGYDDLYTMYTRDILPEDAVDFSLGVAFKDVLLSPNANIAWEPFESRLWAQFGIKYDYVLDFVSDKLTWQNSLDFYWYKKGFWEVSVEYDHSKQMVELGRQYDPKYASHGKVQSEESDGGIANGIFRTALAYAITESISLTVYEAVECNFERQLVKGQKWAKNDEYTSYCGAQLVFSF